MSEDHWLHKQWQREEETKASAYRDRRQRWVERIQSPPVPDLAVIKVSIASMRRLAQELITQNIVPDWYEVEHLAMDYLANAIHAGACSGTEWLEWRMRLAGKPHISSAMSFLSQYAPPTYRFQPPTGNNNLYAQRAEEINTLVIAIELVVADIERVQISQPQPTDTPRPQSSSSRPRERKLRQPPPQAFVAYRISVATGKKQQEIASLISKESGHRIGQAQVSRWIKQVKRWLERGNVLPPLPHGAKHATAIDPAVLDMGARTDATTVRQREKRR